MVRSGEYGGEKVRYKDGVGCCIWQWWKDKNDEETSGMCFDYPEEATDDVAKVIDDLRNDEATVYEPDPEQEERERAWKERETKWWHQLHRKIDDVGFHITLFDWGLRKWLITRPVEPKGSEKISKWCKGFQFGPFTVTW